VNINFQIQKTTKNCVFTNYTALETRIWFPNKHIYK